MKKINLNLSLALFIVGSSLLMACNQNNKKVSDTYNNPDNVAGRVPGDGTND